MGSPPETATSAGDSLSLGDELEDDSILQDPGGLALTDRRVVAKLLGAVVILTHLYDLPKAHLVGVLTVATIGYWTVSTMAWMSR